MVHRPREKQRIDWPATLAKYFVIIMTIAFWAWALSDVFSWLKAWAWPTIKIWLKIQW